VAELRSISWPPLTVAALLDGGADSARSIRRKLRADIDETLDARL
jgi:hypothetical protein